MLPSVEGCDGTHLDLDVEAVPDVPGGLLGVLCTVVGSASTWIASGPAPARSVNSPRRPLESQTLGLHLHQPIPGEDLPSGVKPA